MSCKNDFNYLLELVGTYLYWTKTLAGYSSYGGFSGSIESSDLNSHKVKDSDYNIFIFPTWEGGINKLRRYQLSLKTKTATISLSMCNYLLWKVINPPTAGTLRKYLLLNSSDTSRIGPTKPIKIPIGIPVALHVDA